MSSKKNIEVHLYVFQKKKVLKPGGFSGFTLKYCF